MDILQETMRIDSGRLDIPVYLSLLGADAQRVVPTKKQMGKGATPSRPRPVRSWNWWSASASFSYLAEGPLTFSGSALYRGGLDFASGALPF